MNRYVADSMALILRLENRKMPKEIKEIFLLAERQKAIILIPAMVFAELGYLSEKGKIDTCLEEANKYLQTHANIQESILNFSTIAEAFTIDDIPELHDRLIAAVGKTFNIPVMTNDPEIQKSKSVRCIWMH